MSTKSFGLIILGAACRMSEDVQVLEYNDEQTPGDVVQDPAGTIQAIDKGSVHRICSGQVVLTLATAVKELVENSIDAGATTIEVKLREFGSELIEVTDNGSGVEEKNFEGLTLKHHTSKLQDFSDLVGVNTFGFRGEALSSLCALSNLCVTTKHTSADVGTKLEYDHNGKITSRVPQPRQKGTTITLQNLFSTLPVRHKEFQRNLKKEFVKMIQVLNSYCIISTGVRITCSNQVGKGNRSVVVSSSGNNSMKDNIANVFGSKQLQSLLEFKKKQPNDDISSEYGLKTAENSLDLFDIEGHVSKCTHGQGRSSTDRQFYFVNSRPCDYVKIAKVVNEVYHQYNRHQYPFVALSIKMAKESVDVNVTPDKRQIFLQHEKLLLAVIKMSLIDMYEPTTSILQVNSTAFPCNSVSARTVENESEGTSTLNKELTERENPEKISLSSSLNKLKRSFASAFAKEDNSLSIIKETVVKQVSKQRKLDTFISKSSSSTTSIYSSEHNITSDNDKVNCVGSDYHKVISLEETDTADCDNTSNDDIRMTSNEDFNLPDQTDAESGISSSQETIVLTDSQNSLYSSLSDRTVCSNLSTADSVNTEYFNDTYESVNTRTFNSPCTSVNTETFSQSSSEEYCDTKPNEEFSIIDNVAIKDSETDDFDNEEITKDVFSTNCDNEEQIIIPGACGGDGEELTTVKLTEYDSREDIKKKECKVNFSFRKFKEKVKNYANNSNKSEEFCRNFRAKISPLDNQAAEEELQKEIRKDMFGKMEILGQFNLGFIITKLGEDLFIVDQHATDEKYNFEMLQRHTVLQNQKLIQPQCLELTASNETILMDSLDVFKKNGFDFIVDEEAPPTQRVKLTSAPVSKNWNFGKDDIEELIFMLTDSPGVMCRPTRVRQMFASRACRKSIMIGTALKKSEMKKLVSHMGDIEQPWNCPHGRPTMRHLINLQMVPR